MYLDWQPERPKPLVLRQSDRKFVGVCVRISGHISALLCGVGLPACAWYEAIGSWAIRRITHHLSGLDERTRVRQRRTN